MMQVNEIALQMTQTATAAVVQFTKQVIWKERPKKHLALTESATLKKKLKFQIWNRKQSERKNKNKNEKQQQHQRPTDKQEKQIRQWNLWSCELELACLCARFLSASSHILDTLHLRTLALSLFPSWKFVASEREKKKKKKTMKRYISFNCYFKHRQNLRSCFLLLEMIFFGYETHCQNVCVRVFVFVYANKSANKLKRAHMHWVKKKSWNEMIQHDLLFIQLFNSLLFDKLVSLQCECSSLHNYTAHTQKSLFEVKPSNTWYFIRCNKSI